MAVNEKQISILRAVAGGSTIKAAGETVDVSATRASQHLARICRQLGLSRELNDIRINPSIYLQKLDIVLASTPALGLRRDLVQRLVTLLKLKSEADLTPGYLANISAQVLLNNGVTYVAISEIQEWLLEHSCSLKRTPPETAKEITEVKRAIFLLDAYYFDTANLKKQLHSFLGQNTE